jgi:hypothetical protein
MMKMKRMTAHEYIEAEHAELYANMRRQFPAWENTSDEEVDAMLQSACESMPADRKDALDDLAPRQLAIAVYRGDVDSAVWLLQWFEARGDAPVRAWFKEETDTLLAKAREVSDGGAN